MALFGINLVRILSERGKIQTRINPNTTETFMQWMIILFSTFSLNIKTLHLEI